MLKGILAAAAAAALAVTTAGCGVAAGGSAGGSDKPTVTMVLAVQGCSFCLAVQRGAEDAAKKHRMELKTLAPKSTDAAAQVQMLSSVAATKPDGLVVQPIDPQAVLGTLASFKAQKVPVMTVDTDVNDPSARLGVVTSNNLEGGKTAAAELIKLVGQGGDAGFIGYTPGVAALDERERGFKDVLEGHPGIHLVGSEYTPDDQAAAASKTSALVRRAPGLEAVFASDEANALGAVAGLADAGAQDVKVVAFDGAPSEVQALRRGSVDVLIVQKAYDMGYSAITQLSAQLSDGKKPEPETLLDYVVVTAENVDDPDVQRYLYPSP